MSKSSTKLERYRPYLDGMRTIAVYLVVAYHAGVAQISSGFIGVDIFFVLSGYLVTGILIRDLESPEKRIVFGRFYSRRVRRLLPAALMNLLITAIVFGAIATQLELIDAGKSIRAAALYFANWHFIAQSADYFAADVLNNPVQQYWSLSVEEQYYFAWPIMLAGLWVFAGRFGVHHRHFIQFTIFIFAITSYLLAQILASDDLSRAYYGTDTRAYQLLIGALLSLSPGVILRIRQTFSPTTIGAGSAGLTLAILLLGTDFLDINPISRGLAVALATASLIALLESSSDGWVGAMLSHPVCVYLGKISYGTYLWHWLVVLLLVKYSDFAPTILAAVASIIATVIASFSYHFLEQPIRVLPLLDRHRAAVLISGLGLSILFGLGFSPWVLKWDVLDVVFADGPRIAGENGIPSDQKISNAWFDFYRFNTNGCIVSGPVACTITENGPKRAIIVGESHAGMLTPMLAEISNRHDFSLYAGYLSYCPWPSGMRYVNVGRRCFADQNDLYSRIIPELDPDIVFLAHRPVDDINSQLDLIDKSRGKIDRKSQKKVKVLEHRVTELVEVLRQEGRTVVIFEPIPVVDKKNDTLACLQTATSADQCRFRTRVGAGPEERIFRALAAADENVISVDLDALVCPNLPICAPVVNGLIVKRDDNHLTIKFANSLTDDVEAILLSNGVFD